MVAAFMSLAAAVYPVPAMENLGKTLEVKNWKGNHVGIVKYAVMNPVGNVTFFIVYLDKEARKEVAVPVAAFSSYNREKGTLVLNVSEKQLASAPEFHDSDVNNRAFEETIHRFFGLAPPWTEERKEQGERERTI